MPAIEKILRRFPKQRPMLPAEHQAIYEQEYLANREGGNFITSLAKNLESWMHRKVRDNIAGGRLLEIGAGTLNQVPYLHGKKIACYDVIEPAKFLYENSPNKNIIRNFYDDIEECSEAYDGVFSVAVFEHLVNLPYVLAKTGLLLSEGNGVLVNAVPSEGGMLWGASWRLTTGVAYRLRTGLPYKTLMRHEHVNNLDEIVALHKYFFNEVNITYFPMPLKHLSFYSCIVARHPKIEICKQYINETRNG